MYECEMSRTIRLHRCQAKTTRFTGYSTGHRGERERGTHRQIGEIGVRETEQRGGGVGRQKREGIGRQRGDTEEGGGGVERQRGEIKVYQNSHRYI